MFFTQGLLQEIRCLSAREKGGKMLRISHEIPEEVGLGERFNEKAENLAFGELRLLDIGRAMATQPDILLLDEPFSGLDVQDTGNPDIGH